MDATTQPRPPDGANENAPPVGGTGEARGKIGKHANLGGKYSTGPKPSIADVDAAMLGNWKPYLASIGITMPKRRHGPCPICGGRDRWDFDDKDKRGSSYCRGCDKARDGFTLASEFMGWSMADTLADVAAWAGVTRGSTTRTAPAKRRTPPTQPAHDADAYARKREQAKRTLSECINDRSLLAKYLLARGLSLASIPDDLRLHPALPYFDGGSVSGNYPAVIAPIRDLDGQIVGLHRTYLQPDGSGKADVESPKKMTALWSGALKGGAVRLSEARAGLIVCEGIETGLALLQHTGKPVWCALSAGGLERIQIPPSVIEVIIAADNDSDRSGQGEKSANILAERLKPTLSRVDVMMPPQPGDWLDELLTRGVAHG